jgi:hypothetical protein
VRLRTCLVAVLTALALTGCAAGEPADDDASATAPAGPTSEPLPAPTADDALSPEETVLTFVRAVVDGRGDDAWALLTEGSRSAVGGRDGFDQVLGELEEGVGAFAAAAPQLLRLPLDDGGVLTLAAPVEREGMSELATFAVPYREEGGRVRLAVFDRSERLAEFAAPRREGAVAPGGRIEVYVPAAADAVLTVDGDALDVQTEGVDGDQQRLRAQAPDDLQTDRVYVLTVAWVEVGGRIGADAIPFRNG